MNYKGSERRRASRVEKNVPIKIKEVNFDSVSETRNLSSSGIYCRLDKYIAPMEKVVMILLVPRLKESSPGKDRCKKVECEGTIVRTELVNDPIEGDYYNVAIFFSEIKKADKSYIEKYVKRHLEEK
ncbi:MAG: PilZ domain-containing protein [Candidatus Omnitrophica bacterium]|nr:PilZ domain-containing protein [Candidatus Omnitrophota bacterium]